MKSNEQVISDYLIEARSGWVSIEWVQWALKRIEEANQRGAALNPDYFRAGRMAGDNEPSMRLREEEWG